MGLIRFLFRLVLNLVGAVLILLFVCAIAMWFRSRWTSEECIVSWVQHAPDGKDFCHSTQINAGSSIYVNDTEKIIDTNIVASDAFADPNSTPATTQPTTAPTTHSAAIASNGSVELQQVKRNSMPGSMAVSGPGDQPKVATLGFEYGDKQTADGDRFRWILVPYWMLGLVLLVPVMLWMMLYTRGRSRRAMICGNCHTDLSKPIHRCPECGSPLATPLKVR